MAKISEFTELSIGELDDNDSFHIIDYDGGDKNGSRRLKYSTLEQKLNQRIGINALISTWQDDTSIWFRFQLKDENTKDISVNLSSLVNIYEGQEPYLSVDDDTRKIKLDISAVSHNQTLSGWGIHEVSGQLSVDKQDGKIYSSGKGISVDNVNDTISISGEYITKEVAVQELSGYCLTIFRDWTIS